MFRVDSWIVFVVRKYDPRNTRITRNPREHCQSLSELDAARIRLIEFNIRVIALAAHLIYSPHF